jgi:hypothetical protein
MLREKTMSQMSSYRLLLLCVLVLGFAFSASAQEATIVGSVTDQTGLAIPNVTITLLNTDTGQSQAISSNEAGQFVVPDVHIGTYTIKAENKGFKTWTTTGLALRVGDRTRVDIQMQVGNVTDSITVESGALQVQSESSEISDVVTGTQMADLATNGRNFVTLAALTPGASSAVTGFNFPASVSSNFNISFNGQNPDHNVWMADGGENYDRGSGGKSSIMPSMEAVAEFRTLTSNYSADYGLGSGATMSMVFKSGTTDLHGSAWEFVRNDAFDANDFITKAAQGEKPMLRYNNYGFNLGGPVVLGRFNKDRNKTFFFYNMEWRSLRGTQAINANDPSAAERTGDFSTVPTPILVPTNLAASQLARFAAYGLKPGDQFKYNGRLNVIPTPLLDSNALAFLGAGALPAATSVDSNGLGHLVANASTPNDVREELARIDHRVNDKFSLFGHMVLEQVSTTNALSMWSGDSYPSVGTQFGNPSYSAVAHATYTISPTLVNEASFNYNGNRISILPTGTYVRPSNFTVPLLPPGGADANALNRLPNVNFAKELGTGYNPSWQPWNNVADSYQAKEDLSWVHNRHQFKFGGSFLLYAKTQDTFGNTEGTWNFDGSYTGNAFADFMLGYANAYNQDALKDKGLWKEQSYSVYGQDNWRITDRLTLNLGVRWEGLPHAYEVNNRMSNFYPNLYNPAQAPRYLADGTLDPTGPGFKTVAGVTLSAVPFYMNGIAVAGQGVPRGLVQNSWDTFAPRVGLAWDLSGKGKTVVRAGFGRMYERVQGNDVYQMAGDVPFSYQSNLSNVLFSNPATSAITGLTATAPVGAAGITTEAYSNYKAPTSNQWSIGLQQELWPRAVLSVSYVGNQDIHQSVYRDINAPLLSDTAGRAAVVAKTIDINRIRPYLGFAQINQAENSETGRYNGAQVNFRIQASKGLTLQAAYTLARSVNNVVAVGGGDLAQSSNPYDLNYDKGPSPFDRTSTLVLNYVYDLPFFAHTSNRFQKAMLGGWQISGITTIESGLAITPTTDNTSLGMGGFVANRPNLSGSISYPQTSDQWFSTSAFSAPASLVFGNAGKGCLRGPGLTNFDASLFKNFKGIPWFTNKEGATTQIRFESFNTFNHVEFQNVQTNFSSGNFGKVTSVYPPRTLQFGAKFMF